MDPALAHCPKCGSELFHVTVAGRYICASCGQPVQPTAEPWEPEETEDE